MPIKTTAVTPHPQPVHRRGKSVKRGALHYDEKLDRINDPTRLPVDNEAFIRELALQEQARRAQLIHTGQLISSEELSRRTGMKPQAIIQAKEAGKIFALDGDGGHFWYPTFYADTSILNHGLHSVTQTLGAVPSSSKWRFFTTPSYH